MPARRRAVAAFVSIAICAALHVATWKPLAVQAIFSPGIITTYAGGPGSGTGTAIAQSPWGLAVFGSTLYIADFDHSVVRALNTGTGTETVVAGDGTSGDSGQGGQATNAELNGPASVAVDSSGNLFIGSTYRVQRVDHSTGIITAFAGTGEPGNAGDGGPATAATLDSAWGLAIDASNNVYLSDVGNNRVRRVDHTTGTITAFAGTGFAGFNGNGVATSTELNAPIGISVDGTGNLFIADQNNDRIREVSGGSMTTVAGGGAGGDGGPATSASLVSPRSVWVDGSGNLWIPDTGHFTVRRVDGVTGIITTVAGDGTIGSGGDGGSALSAQLNAPTAAILDGSGNLFISENGGKRLRKVDGGGTITRVAGNGTDCSLSGDGAAATAATLCTPVGVGVDGSGDLFIADQGNNVVREVSSGGVISTFAGDGTQGSSGDTGAATSAQLNQPRAVVADGSGNVFIADTDNNVVRKVSGGTISLFAGNYTAGSSGDGGPATSAQLGGPTALALDSAGNLYIADTNNARVRKVTPGGIISTFAGSTFGNSGDSGPATSAQLESPQGLAVDSTGNVYIADISNGNIRKVDTGGTISTAATVRVRQIAIGPGDRIITASDFSNQVSLVTPNGLAPLAGTGTIGGTGDGGPATSAALYYPVGVAVDSFGTIYIADSHNQKIRRVQAYQLPTAPLAVIATPGAYSARVSWSAPASTGGLPITWYFVTPSVGAPVFHTGSPPFTAVVGNLDPTSSYTFTVIAATAWGSSPASSPSSSITPLLVDPGGIRTNAGSPGYGTAIDLGQVPYAVTVAGPRVLVGDLANPVLRDVAIGAGQEVVLAGTDSYGYSGDAGQALSAMIQGATAIAVCGTDTYIADGFNYVVRKIDASDVITTVAGNGKPGFAGDGGPGTSAQLSRVFGLACRSGGGIYISDSDNGRVRILDGSGTINTWWYNLRFPTGIVELGANDNVAVSNSGSNQVLFLDDFTANLIAGTGVAGYSGDGKAASLAKLDDPRGLAWFGGSPLYIADRANNRIRMVSGTTISTVAGIGTEGFSGDLGAATAAQLNGPTDVTTADGATLYVADFGNYRVRQFTVGSTITTVAGNGTPSFSGDGGQATSAQLGNPYAVTFDAAGNEYVVDNQNNAIRKITRAGVISTVAGTGVQGNSPDGTLATAARLNDPRGVAVNASGDIYFSEVGPELIRKIDHSTGIITSVANGSGPTQMVIDASGDLYWSDTQYNRVEEIPAGGPYTLFAGNGLAGYGGDGVLANSTPLNAPEGLAVDAAGNVYIADTLNNRIRRVAFGTGIITTIAGNGQAGLSGDGHLATLAKLKSPYGLAFDSAGNLYIADTGNERIRVIDTHGIIRTVVGACGINGAFSGDGGPADVAHVNAPFGLATDALGNLFIAEVNSNRVRIASAAPGARNDSCASQAGTPGPRRVTSGLLGSPGTRIPLGGPALRVPMPTKVPTGTTVPMRSAHVFPVRRSARLTGPRHPAAGAMHPSGAQSVAAAAWGAAKPVMNIQPSASREPVPPWYAALLVPFALLVVALVILWRRQRE